jgi:hypothetical protein
MVSSAALDLPKHRQQVRDACLRQNTVPRMQEHLPASSSDAASGACSSRRWRVRRSATGARRATLKNGARPTRDSTRPSSGLGPARVILEDVWESAERGAYPLVHADACNVSAEVERDAGNREAAVDAAGRG